MSISLPPELKAWAEAQVLAGRAASLNDLAALAMADLKLRQDAWAKLAADAIAVGDRDGWIAGDDFIAEIEAAIATDEAEAEAAALAAE